MQKEKYLEFPNCSCRSPPFGGRGVWTTWDSGGWIKKISIWTLYSLAEKINYWLCPFFFPSHLPPLRCRPQEATTSSPHFIQNRQWSLGFISQYFLYKWNHEQLSTPKKTNLASVATEPHLQAVGFHLDSPFCYKAHLRLVPRGLTFSQGTMWYQLFW